ncbi:hypothetical protein HDV62DRAFT_216397 [Trichoderma sp. SZMC 28011]
MHLDISCADLPTVHTYSLHHTALFVHALSAVRFIDGASPAALGASPHCLRSYWLILADFCCELASKKSRVARGGATHPSSNPPKKGDEPGVAIQAA